MRVTKIFEQDMPHPDKLFHAYRMEVSNYQKNYTIDQLVSYSNPGCKLKEC